jgi:peptidyl-prolyl cis-trans isomerase SurA
MDEAFEHSKYILRASHILIKCPSELPKDTLAAYRKAINIRNKILEGLSFAEAAVTYSEDPSARDRVNPQNNRVQPGNKGDLGYFTVFNLIILLRSVHIKRRWEPSPCR